MTGKYERFGRCLDRCESPIERMFLAAMLLLGDTTFEPVDLAPVIARDATGLELGQQVSVDGHRLDFTLSIPGVPRRFAVELDGFVHHGANPAQFERDSARQRAVTGRGWAFLRFSGREVTRDPRRCAQEAMRMAATLVDEASPTGPANARAASRYVAPASDTEGAALVREIEQAEAAGNWTEAVRLARVAQDRVRARIVGATGT